MKRTLLSVAAVLGLSILACSSSNKAKVSDLETGVSGDVKLNEMTSEEFSAACMATDSYRKSVLTKDVRTKFGCNMEAFVAGRMAGDMGQDAAAVCTQTLEGCSGTLDPMADAKDTENLKEQCDAMGPFGADCQGTIAQYEACSREQAEAFVKFVNEFDCENLDRSDAILTMPGVACSEFYEACPGAEPGAEPEEAPVEAPPADEEAPADATGGEEGAI